ncbi:MAG TPA: tungsten ABC transporter substrate-binding protein [Planctomycetaceae bacterium]|nr:tungsten ABC transporter substrate-binding protein [Planctomycetaceae bacterium]
MLNRRRDGRSNRLVSRRLVGRATHVTPLPRSLLLLLLMATMIPNGCVGRSEQRASERPIRWIATTSVQDTGLLEGLVAMLEKRTGLRIEAIAVGSGQAFELARRGDADLLMTHAPTLEREFLREGIATRERMLMSNDFVFVGPPEDPAGVRGMTDPVAMLQKIANSAATFVSRADRSGTHLCELQLREANGIVLPPERLIETGLGQAPSLRVASERGAYTLTDRATWTVHARSLELELLGGGDERLANRYRLFEIGPEHRPAGDDPRVAQLFDALNDSATAEFIDTFGVATYGAALFRSRSTDEATSD